VTAVTGFLGLYVRNCPVVLLNLTLVTFSLECGIIQRTPHVSV